MTTINDRIKDEQATIDYLNGKLKEAKERVEQLEKQRNATKYFVIAVPQVDNTVYDSNKPHPVQRLSDQAPVQTMASRFGNGFYMFDSYRSVDTWLKQNKLFTFNYVVLSVTGEGNVTIFNKITNDYKRGE